MLTWTTLLVLDDPGRAGADVAAALDREPTDFGAWLLLFAAVNLSRPDLVSRAALARLKDLFRRTGLPSAACRLAGEVGNQLLATLHGTVVMDAVMGVLREPNHAPMVYEVMVSILRFAASWAEHLLDADGLMALAGLDHLREHRAFLGENAMERAVLAAGEAAQAQRTLLTRHCLYYLVGKQGLPAEVRDCFPLHDEVERRLGQGRQRVLVIHNIKDGQGDEIARCVPLLQALLDFSPEIEVVLVTRRLYLYANPRINLVPIGDPRVEGVLRERFDVVVDFFETEVKELNHDPELEQRVQKYVQAQKPFLFLSSTKGYHHWLFEQVDVDGRPRAGPLGLDRLRVPNNYETTCRLIAELGLPLRWGETAPRADWVLAGIPWPQAERIWNELTERNRERLPVALLSPFGGTEPLKGYQRPEGIAAEIHRLLGDGFFVVVMPNGNPWGSASAVDQAVRYLPADEREQVAVAPDPAGAPDHADRVMRLATYFVRFADLIVTVEGWMMHEAYCLGKRYRVLMLPYSHSDEWHPYCRTRHQRVYPAAFQQLAAEGDAPPVEQPRKFTLLCILRELGNAGIAEALPFLRRALRSTDRHIRFAAAQSIGKYCAHGVEGDLTALLKDPSHKVRAAAAEALLARSPAPAPTDLMVHKWIGQDNRDWASVYCAGEVARAVLEQAIQGDDPVVLREAAQALRLLDFRQSVRAASKQGVRSFRPLRLLSRVLGL